jgi:succinate dehydrogenase/fumarate reductase iron-sulfur protein
VARLRLRIARGPLWLEAEVEVQPGLSLLDALETLRAGPGGDPSLLYRHSCHHGSCGTCGALVDGAERLMCLTSLESLLPGPVTIEPLRKAQRIGDLAVLPSALFASLPEGSGYLRSSEVAHRAVGPRSGPPERLEDCIECGLCLSACPVPEDRPFAGPAALAAADRDREERPAREPEALAFAARPEGVAACDRRFACSRACPQGVAPGRRIEALRRSLAARGGGG